MSSATPRRSARLQEMNSSTVGSSTPDGTPTRTAAMATRRSPFIPTTIEMLLLALYPLTLAAGSLFALVDPATRASPYNAVSQSHDLTKPPSYFASKNNIFNVLFVKRGWFWVTAAYFLFLFTHPSTGPSGSALVTPKRIRGVLRWSLVTLWWVFVTQWFFGPAIIDRGFRLTGGACQLAQDAEDGKIEMDDTRQFLTGVACKAVGGRWAGGHDISGHVFLLVLGSMFLIEEVMHILMGPLGAEERTVLAGNGSVKSAEAEAADVRGAAASSVSRAGVGVKAVLGVAGLSLWMLLMTAAYFHTWFEKFTGLLVAFSGIFVVYFLPRIVPTWRGIVGMPGI